jgi:hypothetical protein
MKNLSGDAAEIKHRIIRSIPVRKLPNLGVIFLAALFLRGKQKSILIDRSVRLDIARCRSLSSRAAKFPKKKKTRKEDHPEGVFKLENGSK